MRSIILSLPVVVVVVVSLAGVLATTFEYPEDVTRLENALKLYNSAGLPTKDCQKPDINGDGITFNFYTRERFMYNLTVKDIEKQIHPAYYHVNKVTKIIVHGWQASSKMEAFERMIYDYLYMQNVNVIAMDWSVYAKKCNLKSTFTDVTYVAGEALNKVMKALLSRGTNATKFHVVGFAAGAHIAAVAAKLMHPHMIGRITALDPTGLNYDLPGYPKLHTGDAYLVDVIYTTHGAHASQRDFGHIVFYPDGGRHPQYGCDESDELCSMYKSVSYFRRSIVTPYAYPAKKISQHLNGPRPERENEETKYTPDNYMGEYVEPSKHGKYYVNVRYTKPQIVSDDY